jgi:hypothetical protein
MKVKVIVAKFHINPEKGPRPCSAQEGQCPYGSDAPHFPTKAEAQEAFEEALSKEIKPLGSLKRITRSELSSRKQQFAKDFESMDYSGVEAFANASRDNHRIIDSLIKDRSEESYERYLKLEKINPAYDKSAEKCDIETFRSLKRDYEADRDRTAELVEAFTESKYYVPNALQLEDPSRIGTAVRTTGFEPNTPEWLRARFDTVGGSDVGVLAKVDFTPVGQIAYYDKKALERAEQSKLTLPTKEDIELNQNLSRIGKVGPLYRGTVWEKRIRDDYAREHPEMKVYDTKDQFVNVSRDWQKINLDGVLSDREDGKPNGILEVKTGGNAKVWKDGVPIAYRAQGLYYLNATGLDFIDYRAYINDHEVIEHRLYANDEVAVGSGVNIEQYIEGRVTPWFRKLKAHRELVAA